MATETYSNQLKSDQPVSIKTLNKAFAGLVRSDNSRISDASKLPGLWEQRWYNERDNTDLYYKKGEAVWLNTEQIDSVVNARQDELYAYAASNALLKKRLDECRDNDDKAGYLALLKDFALGNADKRKGPIYFLGELTANAQVKISLSNDNTAYPDDDKFWTDFIFDDSEEDIALSIYTKFAEYTDDAINRHLIDCHLSGYGVDKTSLSSNFMLKDFSNLSGEQQLKSHMWYADTITGFDHVKEMVVKKYGGGLVKWYRIWDSGFLEHGGIVNADTPIAGDSRDGLRYDVSLNWEDVTGKTAVTYDYPSEGLHKFYGNETGYSSDSKSWPLKQSALGSTYRYSVTVTPVSSTPYASFGGDGICDQVETCFLNNTGFSFLASNNMQKLFSYKVEGYSVRGSVR